eukprot:GEMP01059051.1.p1 GENE.GEMP01059051.1~~GEMP01059051.1.p1  ORF type:complete len:329 (+),score=76.05 GEMP01059051.1:68-988(+)
MKSDSHRLYSGRARPDGSGPVSPSTANWTQVDELRKETMARKSFASRIKKLTHRDQDVIPATASKAEQKFLARDGTYESTTASRWCTVRNPAPHGGLLVPATGDPSDATPIPERGDTVEHEMSTPLCSASSSENMEMQLRRRVAVLSTEVNHLRVLLANQQEIAASCSECASNSAQLREENAARVRAESALRQARAEGAKFKIVPRNDVRVSSDDPRLTEMRRVIVAKDEEIRTLRKRCLTLETKLDRKMKKDMQPAPHILPDFNDVLVARGGCTFDSSPKSPPRIISCQRLPMPEVLSLECVSDF